MCNFIFNSLFSMHYNRCTNSERKKRSLLGRRRSLPALPMINRQAPEKPNSSATPQPTNATDDDILLAAANEQIDYEANNSNRSHNEQLEDQKQLSKGNNNGTDESDESDNYDQFDTTDTVCGCGKTLAKGWVCNDCRIQCSTCNRALSTDPDDYCSRCYFKCQEHGLVLKKKNKTIMVSLDTCHLCNDESPSAPDNNTNNCTHHDQTLV